MLHGRKNKALCKKRIESCEETPVEKRLEVFFLKGQFGVGKIGPPVKNPGGLARGN
jgi:hypothetical protein